MIGKKAIAGSFNGKSTVTQILIKCPTNIFSYKEEASSRTQRRLNISKLA